MDSFATHHAHGSKKDTLFFHFFFVVEINTVCFLEMTTGIQVLLKVLLSQLLKNLRIYIEKL